jgi:hypothetical protein
VAKNVPQTVRPGFDEFLKLDRRQADSVAVRNRTKRAAVMRRDAGLRIPVKGLSFSECESAKTLFCRTIPPIIPSSGCRRPHDATAHREVGSGTGCVVKGVVQCLPRPHDVEDDAGRCCGIGQ